MSILTPSTTFADALTSAAQGKTSSDQLVDWLNSTIVDLIDDDYESLGEFLGSVKIPCAVARKQSELRAKSSTVGAISAKIAKRGGISFAGLNAKYPVTLYASQWRRLLAYIADCGGIDKLVSALPPTKLLASKDFDADKDKEYLVEIQAGLHSHARCIGDLVTIHVATRS
jgi:hypothetical protein